jgi:hypothetical protein
MMYIKICVVNKYPVIKLVFVYIYIYIYMYMYYGVVLLETDIIPNHYTPCTTTFFL